MASHLYTELYKYTEMRRPLSESNHRDKTLLNKAIFQDHYNYEAIALLNDKSMHEIREKYDKQLKLCLDFDRIAFTDTQNTYSIDSNHEKMISLYRSKNFFDIKKARTLQCNSMGALFDKAYLEYEICGDDTYILALKPNVDDYFYCYLMWLCTKDVGYLERAANLYHVYHQTYHAKAANTYTYFAACCYDNGERELGKNCLRKACCLDANFAAIIENTLLNDDRTILDAINVALNIKKSNTFPSISFIQR